MYYLGIDLGGMSIKAGICDDNGKILLKDTCPTVRTEDGDRIINDMADLCLKVIKQAGLTPGDIEYAGIASPGSADSEHGLIIYAATLPFLNYPVAQKLFEKTVIKRSISKTTPTPPQKAKRHTAPRRAIKIRCS